MTGKNPMRKTIMTIFIGVCLTLALCACGAVPPEAQPEAEPTADPPAATEPTASEEAAPTATPTPEDEYRDEEISSMLQMMIGDTAVEVDWEENESVAALRELCREEPLTIELSMYGGFEQVGPIGTSLPRSDEQTTTAAGDVVLYAGNQIVVFYGANSWAYTRLGHISDQSAEDLAALLGNGDVTLTLWLGVD